MAMDRRLLVFLPGSVRHGHCLLHGLPDLALSRFPCILFRPQESRAEARRRREQQLFFIANSDSAIQHFLLLCPFATGPKN